MPFVSLLAKQLADLESRKESAPIGYRQSRNTALSRFSRCKCNQTIHRCRCDVNIPNARNVASIFITVPQRQTKSVSACDHSPPEPPGSDKSAQHPNQKVPFTVAHFLSHLSPQTAAHLHPGSTPESEGRGGLVPHPLQPIHEPETHRASHGCHIPTHAEHHDRHRQR